jgi:hypothetical protein
MGFLKKLFLARTTDRSANSLNLSDLNHVAHQQIDEACQIADRIIDLSPGVFSVTNTEALRLAAAIDKALSVDPGNPNLLLAKASALSCALQNGAAKEVIGQVLASDGQNFEALMRRDHWAKWGHLFFYPTWSSSSSSLHPVMARSLKLNQAVQLVRDGLQIGMAIVKDATGQSSGLSNKMRSTWWPVLADTPYGPVVAHYVLIEDDPAAPLRMESLLTPSKPEEADPYHAYWLLQRMSQLSSCYIVATDGERVVHNVRHGFSQALKSELQRICQALAGKSPVADSTRQRNAMQWYMNNCKMPTIQF